MSHSASSHAVGLRELRHHTGDVIDRVRHGEVIDLTDRGKLVARIVPVEERTPTPILQRLIEQGQVQRATRPGYRPPLRRGGKHNLLTDTLAQMRDEERW